LTLIFEEINPLTGDILRASLVVINSDLGNVFTVPDWGALFSRLSGACFLVARPAHAF